ncbi:PREDICTED: glutamyl aminopeptidase-like [Trachymyrmex septentrionalis]|uniref:glutamyl aminopeptidase-like n=1 Tax=Trachymyrmex septentrionalis TaxID=34720 RepID=UPI00084F116B|nr:PREDICTED: glutamyl aminopeptidase-like [Trachymyrmex septentrionalis]
MYILQKFLGRLLLAPLIQANGVRQLFPCWDQSHLKATFNISIKHPRYYSALSNMPTKFVTYENNSDSIHTYFYITPPMSISQVAIVMTNYNFTKINENVTLWLCYSEKKSSKLFEFARRIIYNITLHLKSEFNGINIPKMDHVAIPNFPQDGTSKWGLIFHTEANIIYNKKLDPFMRKIEVARLIASKIAYQWFSNVLNIWWLQFWLHDGFANIFGEEAIAKSFNSSEVMDLFVVQNQYESLHLDSHYNMNSLKLTVPPEIDSIFSFPRYIKVIIILRMLQSAITDKVFRNNIHTYINRQHYPIVSLEQEADPFKRRLSQIKYNSTSYGKWWIPINLSTNNLKQIILNFTTCLTPDLPSFTVQQQIDGAYVWIVNIQRAGYYRVKYDLQSWYAIVNDLNSTAGEYKEISVINRAKIIDDAFHLMMERQLNVSVFWNLTQFLSQETNFIVWYPMFKVFEYMSNIFPYSENEIKYIDIIKEKFRKMLDPLIIMLQKSQTDFNRCLKQEILKWACALEHLTCINKTRSFTRVEALDILQRFNIMPL